MSGKTCLLLVVSVCLTGCSRTIVRPTGYNLLETNADAACSEAFHQAASRVQTPQLHDDDPTNNAAGPQLAWESQNHHLGDDAGTYWQRGVTRFEDANGVKYTVESTQVRGRLTLWSFEATDAAAARVLRDEVARRTVALASGKPAGTRGGPADEAGR